MNRVALTFALSMTLFLGGCPPFQPEVALRPAPYRSGASFVAPAEVHLAPELDRGTFPLSTSPEYRTDPGELAQTPELVRACLVAHAGDALRGYRVVAPGSEPSAFTLSFALVTAHPGFFRADRISTASAGANANGAGAGATGGAMTAGTSSPGQAEMLLEVRSSAGVVVDRVRVYAQRQAGVGEALDSRAGALCGKLLEEVAHYLAWRIEVS